MNTLFKKKIGIVGLGYVGLPLAIAFAKKYESVVGFDIGLNRIMTLKKGYDETKEIDSEVLLSSDNLEITNNANALEECDVMIVTVPTPIDKNRSPDLGPLRSASETVGKHLSKGNVVIYESTVYPGATEEECVPILEATSGLRFNVDFFVGYSPERINPGDKVHTVEKIVKVTSGSTKETSDFVANLYNQITDAGTHKASSIKVAEAAKVIENTQRDLNIALMNELCIIFERLSIDTLEVLEAASTKWNFLPFRPGLVGGHCIRIDPYYLTHKAESVGYHPQVILAGRRINDGMGRFVVQQVSKLLNKKRKPLGGSQVLVLGLTFKENCPDVRNSGVYDIIDELVEHEALVEVYDPVANEATIISKSFTIVDYPKSEFYDAIICAVGHQHFIKMGTQQIRSLGKPNAVLFDVKSIFPKHEVDGRL